MTGRGVPAQRPRVHAIAVAFWMLTLMLGAANLARADELDRIVEFQIGPQQLGLALAQVM